VTGALPFGKECNAVLSVCDVVEVFSSAHGCPLLPRPPEGAWSRLLCDGLV
jgi:hypothetical protein